MMGKSGSLNPEQEAAVGTEKTLTREEALRRARGIMARMGSNNPNEAAVAATKLDEILNKYRITLVDVRASLEENTRRARATMGHDEVRYAKSRFSPLKEWKERLAATLAGHFDLHVHISDRVKLVWAGDEATVEAAIGLWNYLVTQLEMMAGPGWTKAQADHVGPLYAANKQHMDPMKWRHNFFMGANEVIRERLFEIKRARENDPTQKGLVLASKAAVAEYVASRWSLGRGVARNNEWDEGARSQGRAAGRKADLGMSGGGYLGPGR